MAGTSLPPWRIPAWTHDHPAQDLIRRNDPSVKTGRAVVWDRVRGFFCPYLLFESQTRRRGQLGHTGQGHAGVGQNRDPADSDIGALKILVITPKLWSRSGDSTTTSRPRLDSRLPGDGADVEINTSMPCLTSRHFTTRRAARRQPEQ